MAKKSNTKRLSLTLDKEMIDDLKEKHDNVSQYIKGLILKDTKPEKKEKSVKKTVKKETDYDPLHSNVHRVIHMISKQSSRKGYTTLRNIDNLCRRFKTDKELVIALCGDYGYEIR
jgi:predicted Zn-ribbon and HTH transcriptional regulator